MLSKNTEVGVGQLLASAYVLHFYKSYLSHISDQNWELLGGGQPLEGGKTYNH